MRGIIILFRFLPVAGMALFPFVLLRKSDSQHDDRLLNHERIHLRQQLELLILPFYCWYVLEYLFYRIKGLKHDAAYRSIIFEREAYKHDSDSGYLAARTFWAFLRV